MLEKIGRQLGETGSETLTNLVRSEEVKRTAEPLSQRQFAVVDRFYTALRAIYGSKFDQQFTSIQDIDESKQMWGADIASKTDGQLMGCISNVKARIRAGDSDWLWPNIGMALGYVDNSWEGRDSFRPFSKEKKIEDLTAKAVTLKTGNRAIKDMMRGL